MKKIRIKEVKSFLVQPGHVPLVVVKIITDNPEIVGYGCATYTQRATAVKAVLDDYLAPLVVGKDASNIEDLWNLMINNGYWRNGPVINNAVSGIDMALWDIKGKVTNQPCYQLWGGKSREHIPVYVHVNGNTFEEVKQCAEGFLKQGYKTLRCQFGGYLGKPTDQKLSNDFSGDIFNPEQILNDIPELFKYLRKELGYDFGMIYDVHERLTPNQSLNLAKALEPYRLLFLEDIVSTENLEWLQKIRGKTVTPLAMGELFTNVNEYLPLIKNRLIDFIRVHPSAIGGITPALKLAHMCDFFGVKTAWHGPKDVSPIGMAAAVHMDFNVSNFGIQEWDFRYDHEKDIFPGGAYLKDGAAYIDDKPGLGIGFDEDLAIKYPFKKEVIDWTQLRLVDGTIVKP